MMGLSRADWRQMLVTNFVTILGMFVVIALVRRAGHSEELLFPGILATCVAVFALCELGITVMYGGGLRSAARFLCERAFLTLLIVAIVVFGTVQALMQVAAGIDPTSDITFGIVALLFPAMGLATQVTLAFLAPKLLAAKK